MLYSYLEFCCDIASIIINIIIADLIIMTIILLLSDCLFIVSASSSNIVKS